MDGSPTPPTPPAPPATPYRAGKPLAEIIPPDRRRERAIALVGASMIAGVVLWVLGGWALDALQTSIAEPVQPLQTPGYVAGRVPRSTLSGPGGIQAMPPPVRSVVNVWLQGCVDCMPAFNAMAQLQREGGMNVEAPVINVAYGEADETWARRYGVATNLVFDPGGGALVKPLGIGTFTTLVVEPDGTIIHRDRPDRDGYLARVRSAVKYGDPLAITDPGGDPLAVPPPPSGAGVFDIAAVQRVVAQHRASIKRTCWDRTGRTDAPSHVDVTVAVTVATDGRVTATTSSGDEPVIAKCIEAQTRTWRFPPPSAQTTVNIPFKFVQQ